ncbi:unnamed protein product [Ilex paraguariensis]|uniref:Uncharacterized protein n=1 Tax=Ilex paraguariensis TaxID=185542 RepID=A0ABC8SUF6_9AQUA
MKKCDENPHLERLQSATSMGTRAATIVLTGAAVLIGTRAKLCSSMAEREKPKTELNYRPTQTPSVTTSWLPRSSECGVWSESKSPTE